MSEALAQIQSLEDNHEWSIARRIDKVYAYRNYLNKFPSPNYEVEARKRIGDLVGQEQEPILIPESGPLKQSGSSPKIDDKEVKSSPQNNLPKGDIEEKRDKIESISYGLNKGKAKKGILLLALGWGIASLIASSICILFIQEISFYKVSLIFGIIAGGVGGLIMGWVIKRIFIKIKLNQVFLIAIAWLIGGVTASVIFILTHWIFTSDLAGYIGLVCSLIIALAAGGLITGNILMRQYIQIRWKQIRLIAIGWAIAGLIGTGIGFIIGQTISSKIINVIDPIIFDVIIFSIVGTVGGAIGGSVMFWQFRNVQNPS